MSKRRNRKTSRPNVPQETLDRARREAGLEPEIEPEAAEEAPAPPVTHSPEPVAARHRDEALPRVQRRPRRKREVEPELLSAAEISERLANPTKQVSEEELRAQYSYVLKDLRSMGLLAAVLFVAMIVAAQLL